MLLERVAVCVIVDRYFEHIPLIWCGLNSGILKFIFSLAEISKLVEYMIAMVNTYMSSDLLTSSRV